MYIYGWSKSSYGTPTLSYVNLFHYMRCILCYTWCILHYVQCLLYYMHCFSCNMGRLCCCKWHVIMSLFAVLSSLYAVLSSLYAVFSSSYVLILWCNFYIICGALFGIIIRGAFVVMCGAFFIMRWRFPGVWVRAFLKIHNTIGTDIGNPPFCFRSCSYRVLLETSKWTQSWRSH